MSNIQQAIKQAQLFQQKIADLQKKLEGETVLGVAGGGLMKITCTGKGKVLKVDIDPSLIDPNDKEMLEDLVVAAFNDANKKADERSREEMEKISSSSGIPMDLLNSAF